MLSEVVWLSVAAHAAELGTCELCMTAATELSSIVVVRDAPGSVAEFVACDRCARAVRRVAAAAGGQVRFAPASDVPMDASASEAPLEPVRRRRRTVVRIRKAKLIREYVEHVRDADGTEYLIRVYGQARADGTWIGWIEFTAIGAAIVRRTNRETTQSTREDLAYWAGGLEASYLEGAFRRARRLRVRASAARS